MEDFADRLFQHAADLTRVYGAGMQSAPVTVWLLWVETTVCGVYRTRAAAEKDAALIGTVSRIEERHVG